MQADLDTPRLKIPPRPTKTVSMPLNEVERLRALHHILDGALPPGLDRICSVAWGLFRVPIVRMVFLGEDGAWIKNASKPRLSESPRKLSFCNYTVMHDEVFVVPDTPTDRRFVTHPYVTANQLLRFYEGSVHHGAGCPDRLDLYEFLS